MMLRTILLEPLFNILLVLYALIPGGDFGVAIIALTILIRLALWPLVKKQLLSQKTLRDLQPEITKLKKKAKGDRTREAQMMAELFKEKQVNPFASIGLALVQLPILLTLYFVLRDVVQGNAVIDTAYAFIQDLPAIAAIVANPAAFDPSLLGLVHMASPNLILALLAGLAQYAQAKQMMPGNTTASDPAAKLGFNLTLIFPIVTVAIAATLPSALALYWAVSSLVAVIQQHSVLETDVTLMQKLRRRSARAKTKGKAT